MAGGPHQWNSSTLEEHPVAQRLREYLQKQSQAQQSQLEQNTSHTNTASSSTQYIRRKVRQELQDRLIMVPPLRQHQQEKSLLVRQYRIIAGGGQHRIVPVPPNTWDALAWIALLKEEEEEEEDEEEGELSSTCGTNKNEDDDEDLLHHRKEIRARLLRELQHLELL